MHQVLLVPATVVIDHPGLRIFERKENVVDVDENARSERRQHIEIEMIDVAARFRDVGRVDEQDIAGSELGEFGKRNVLHLIRDEARYTQEPVLEECARIRFDAGEVDLAVEPPPIHVGHEQRRVAGTHFNDPLRAPGVQQYEQRACIEPTELLILGIELD